MTDYYCDLGEGTFADNAGTATGTAYTGPAGLQAAIRGTGSATALAAGDTLYIKGTGDLSRLVLLDCNGTDVSAWAPTNVVRNKDGAGDDWTGVVVQANDDPPGNLGADDLVLVWLDSGKSVDDIDLADGIENTTLAESADPLAAKSAPGVYFVNNGSSAAPIKFVGVNSSWKEDDTMAVMDGNDKAVTGFARTEIRSYIDFRNIHVTRTTSSAWAAAFQFRNCSWVNCEASASGAHGFSGGGSLQYSSMINCRAYDNNQCGFGNIYGSSLFGCTAYNNGAEGFHLTYSNANNCVSYENVTGYNIARGCSLTNCVADKNTYGVDLDAGAMVVGSRITNNTTYGLMGAESAHDPYCFYSDNGENFQSDVYDDRVYGESTRVTSGTIGYIDNDDATANADRNYGLTNAATSRRQEVTL